VVNVAALTCFVELLGHDGIICPVVNVAALTCFVELLGHDGIICPVALTTGQMMPLCPNSLTACQCRNIDHWTDDTIVS
jgi:hypothetical protein